jgi:hypothetical protein
VCPCSGASRGESKSASKQPFLRIAAVRPALRASRSGCSAANSFVLLPGIWIIGSNDHVCSRARSFQFGRTEDRVCGRSPGAASCVGRPWSTRAIALIVKRSVVRALVDEGVTVAEAAAIAEEYSGHSLRAGHATPASQNGAPGHAIQRQLRHKSSNTTAGYIREGRLFKGSSAFFALR